MKKTTVWHGTSTGENGKTLQSIFNDGLRPEKADLERSHQRAGIYFVPDVLWAAMYAQGEPYSKGGDPLLINVKAVLDARYWDIDHEMTGCSLEILSHFKAHISKAPPGLLNIQGYINEKILNIRCTKDCLVLSGERVGAISPERYPAGAFEHQIPWTDPHNQAVLTDPFMWSRLQRLHDFLRKTLKDEYTDKLQQALNQVQKKRIPIKYIGPTGLIVEAFFTQPQGLGIEHRNLWKTLNPSNSHKKQELADFIKNPPPLKL